MGLLNVIRTLRLRHGLAIREIARRTGLSRNTIKKHLKAGTIEPQFATPDRQSKLDPFADKLAGWLKTEGGKSRKQQRTMKQLHADLVALGFTGSYARVAAFARRWRADRQREQQTTGRGTFVPLHFDPGDAFQFDWSEDFAVLGGERIKLQMAHIKLSHSRAFLLRAYPLQTHEMLFDAHWHGFRVFGGVPGRGIYDNMKTAVDRVGRGKERQINMRFLAMTNHYVYEPEFCNPAAGWEKGQVEKNVRDSRHQMLQEMPDFPDLAALNAWLEERCLELWRETPHGKQPGTIADVWAEEQAALMPLPVAFDGFIELSKRVSPTCLISFERNRYSVPASFANRPVSLRIYPDRLVVAAEGNILCEHARVIQRNHTLPSRTIYDWRHYLAIVQRKPGALRNGAPFLELPHAFRQLQDHMLRKPGGDREMVDILALVLHHDEQAVLTAVELALAEGVPTKTHVLNLLHRLVDGKVIGGPPLDTPQALALHREPKANVARYDGLRAEITLEAEFCLEALNEAIHKFGPPEIMNTDQGSQFTSFDWTDRLKRAKTKISMDGKARYLDNIFIERLWRSLKYECVYLHAWETGSQAKAGVGRWITFYNHLRPHAAHGGQPPAVVYFNATQTDQQVQAVA